MFSNLGVTNLAVENITKAYNLRDRVSEREKYDISSQYFAEVTGDLEKALQTYDAWVRLYPSDAAPRHNRANIYEAFGQYEKASEGYRESIRMQPEFLYSHTNLANCFIALNRLEDARSAIGALKEYKLDPELGWAPLYKIAFLKNDSTEMERLLHEAVDRPGAEDDVLSIRADTEAYYGRLKRARNLWRRLVELEMRAGSRELAATSVAEAALKDAEFGNSALAKQGASTSLSMYSGQGVHMTVALTLAGAGDVTGAKLMSTKLEQRNPLNTIQNRYWLPTIKAVIKLKEGNPSEAVALLETTRGVETRVCRSVVSALRARPSLSSRTPMHRSRRRVPENPRPSWDGAELAYRRTGASRSRTRVRIKGRRRQGEGGLSRFLHALERRRPRHPHSHSCQG